MSKNKQRSGLQKDFAAIFEGVWVPKKASAARPASKPNPPEQEQQAEQAEQADRTNQAEHIEQIEKIIASMTCSKGFECFKSGFENLCRVRIVGNGKVIECPPENRQSCEYRFGFMDKTFCKCRLRYYIARNLNK
jgi:hypothetical protein